MALPPTTAVKVIPSTASSDERHTHGGATHVRRVDTLGSHSIVDGYTSNANDARKDSGCDSFQSLSTSPHLVLDSTFPFSFAETLGQLVSVYISSADGDVDRGLSMPAASRLSRLRQSLIVRVLRSSDVWSGMVVWTPCWFGGPARMEVHLLLL